MIIEEAKKLKKGDKVTYYRVLKFGNKDIYSENDDDSFSGIIFRISKQGDRERPLNEPITTWNGPWYDGYLTVVKPNDYCKQGQVYCFRQVLLERLPKHP